jgi:hypothetical protein
MDAAAWTKPDREERVSIWGSVFLAGLFAFILTTIFESGSWTPIITMAAICTVTQILSPFDPTTRKPAATSNPATGKPKTVFEHAFAAVDVMPRSSGKAGWYQYRVRRRIERQQWREMRREQRRMYRGEHRVSLLSFPAFVFIVAACVAALAIALRFVDALQAGLPHPSVLSHLQHDVFSGYSDWPPLLLKLAACLTVLLTMLGVTTIALARRHRGPLHILRGVFGTLLLIGSIFTIGGAFRFGDWDEISGFVQHHQPAPAIATFLNSFNGVIVLSAIMFVVSIIILAWTPRREPMPIEENYGGAPPQSGSAPAATQPKSEGAAAP